MVNSPLSEPPHSKYSELYKVCFEKTKIYHARHSKLWHPRLLSPNDLDFNRSNIVSGPVGRLGIFIVDIYNALISIISKFIKFLFPKRKKIYGRPSENNTISGRLTFGKKLYDLDQPIYNMRLEVWCRTWWGGFRKVAQGFSVHDGSFSLPYDLLFVRQWWIRRVWLGIYQTGHAHFVRDQQEPDYIFFEKVKIQKKDLVGIDLSLGTIQMFYWEYRTDTSLPRVEIKDHDKDAPDHYSPGRLPVIEKIYIPIELIKLKHLNMIRDVPGKLTLAQIQADYPENLTVCMEKMWPGVTRSDKWFGERMMNGMYASDFDRDPSDPSRLWIHYHWNSYDKNLHYYAMPDVDIYFVLDTDGLPLPVEIILTGPLRAGETNRYSRRSFRPEDGEKWMAAKRVARISGALYSELGHHFAGTHVNTEQFAIAVFRQIRLNPVAGLLKPFLHGVVLVNHTADQILVGNGYITSACALTPKGISQVIEKVLGTMDWKNYRPMKPVSPAHQFANIANLYWNIVSDFVTDFIDDPANRPDILKYWFEIYLFSKDLVEHSVPAFLCNYLRGQLLTKNGEPKTDYGKNWYLTEHRMDLQEKDFTTDSQEKALSPVTLEENGANISEFDLANLKQVCTYIIYQATFGHTWANSKQYDDIGEVLYNSLGLRFGNGPEGVLGPESDLSIAPDLTRATQMMWWSNMLSRTGYGFIMANEDGDISPKLIQALKNHEQAFKDQDFDINIIQSRTNI